MLFKAYQHFSESDRYNKFTGDDYLIVEFKCPIEVNRFLMMSRCHFIVHVLSGKKTFSTGEKEWTISPGTSVFVRKGAYFNELDLGEDLCVLMFFLSDSFLKSFMHENIDYLPEKVEHKTEKDPIYPIEVTTALELLYDSMYTYLHHEGPLPRKMVELKFQELLLNILSNQENRSLSTLMLDLANFEGSELPQIMEDNYQYNLALEDYAELCGRSLSSFKRDFKDYYGTTPGKWITKKRLERAKTLLLSSRKTIQEICYDCGFENSSHFTQKFKKHFGDTPTTYRQIVQQADSISTA